MLQVSIDLLSWDFSVMTVDDSNISASPKVSQLFYVLLMLLLLSSSLYVVVACVLNEMRCVLAGRCIGERSVPARSRLGHQELLSH